MILLYHLVSKLIFAHSTTAWLLHPPKLQTWAKMATDVHCRPSWPCSSVRRRQWKLQPGHPVSSLSMNSFVLTIPLLDTIVGEQRRIRDALKQCERSIAFASITNLSMCQCQEVVWRARLGTLLQVRPPCKLFRAGLCKFFRTVT